MPIDSSQQVNSNPTQFYSTAPVNSTYATANASGQVTLVFPQVPSGQVFTGSITIVPATGGALSGTIWTVTRDGSTPFLIWYDNQVGVDLQARDGQALTITGTGLTANQQVSAIWAGRNDPTASAPVVAPSVSGSPSYLALIQAVNNATSLLALLDVLLGSTAPSALTTAAGVAIAQDFLHANVGVTTEVASLLATGSATGSPGGIPLLRLTNNLGNASNATIAAGVTSTLLTTTTINQPGYEAEFMVSMPASSGTVPFLKLIVVWTDSVSGLTVGQRTFFLTCGNGSTNALSFYIFGPARGNEISMTLTNLDASATATYSWTFNMTSHIYTADKIVQPSFATTAPNGYTNPVGFPNAAVLLNSNPTILASAATSRLLPVYSGRATIMVNNSGSTTLHAYLTDPVATGSGLYGNVQSRYEGFDNTHLASGDTVMQEIFLPYGPLLLTLTNESTTASGTCNVGIIGSDY